MKLNIFGKEKNSKEKGKTAKIEPQFSEPEKKENAEVFKNILPTEYGVLKGFYVSEKASGLNFLNQYVFKVFSNATKNEVKKQVEKSFNVKVKGVRMINLPKKARTVGRHSGFRQGVRKAVVVLRDGYTIEQAKP